MHLKVLYVTVILCRSVHLVTIQAYAEYYSIRLHNRSSIYSQIQWTNTQLACSDVMVIGLQLSSAAEKRSCWVKRKFTGAVSSCILVVASSLTCPTRATSSRRCRRVGRLPRVQLARRLPDWSAGGLLRCIVLSVCSCVVSFSKVHEPDTHDFLRTNR